jgi:hypothetical protein
MARNFRDKVALSGITVLGIGLALLVATFVSAALFMSEALPILASQDLVQTFGETLAPLIATSIRVMYLGVMGWIGSLVTIRGVTLIANAPKIETNEPQKPQELKQKKPQPQVQQTEETAKPKQEKPRETKPEAKPGEPDLVVIPPEEMEQQTQQTQP